MNEATFDKNYCCVEMKKKHLQALFIAECIGARHRILQQTQEGPTEASPGVHKAMPKARDVLL